MGAGYFYKEKAQANAWASVRQKPCKVFIQRQRMESNCSAGGESGLLCIQKGPGICLGLWDYFRLNFAAKALYCSPKFSFSIRAERRASWVFMSWWDISTTHPAMLEQWSPTRYRAVSRSDQTKPLSMLQETCCRRRMWCTRSFSFRSSMTCSKGSTW